MWITKVPQISELKSMWKAHGTGIECAWATQIVDNLVEYSVNYSTCGRSMTYMEKLPCMQRNDVKVVEYRHPSKPNRNGGEEKEEGGKHLNR